MSTYNKFILFYFIRADIISLNFRNDNKRKILISTLKLIDEKPFPQVSTKEIAELTGISEGAIFRHYKTKEILLQELCKEFLNLTTTLDLKNLESEKEFKIKLVQFFQFLQKLKIKFINSCFM